MKREEKMGKSEKQMDKEHERNQRIIDTAFRLFVEKKIEAKPFPMNFGEPAFISTYKTAYMVFMESVRK